MASALDFQKMQRLQTGLAVGGGGIAGATKYGLMGLGAGGVVAGGIIGASVGKMKLDQLTKPLGSPHTQIYGTDRSITGSHYSAFWIVFGVACLLAIVLVVLGAILHTARGSDTSERDRAERRALLRQQHQRT